MRRRSGALASGKVVIQDGDTRLVVDMTEYARVLSDINTAAESPGEDVLELVGEDIVEGIQEEFETAGHGKWEPLAESTMKSRRGTIAQILVDTGAMRGSIDESAIEVSDTSVTVASNVEYQVFHVSDEARTKIPLRDFYDIQEKYYDLAAETLLDGILKEAGFQ